jgi:VanZ family protein
MLVAWTRLPHWLRVLPPIATMAFLWWSSSRTPTRQPPNVARELMHNGAHVVAYAVLAAGLWLVWTRGAPAERRRWRSRISWLLATAYGVVDEGHQAFVPGRVCSLADVVSDAGGAALAIALLRWQLGLAARPRATLFAWVAVAAIGVLLATFTRF